MTCRLHEYACTLEGCSQDDGQSACCSMLVDCRCRSEKDCAMECAAADADADADADAARLASMDEL